MGGIHHITAVASDARACVAFYAGILGLRLVKKTVNQDDVSAYHLFFGDREGRPGMDLTFFVFQPVMKAEIGMGCVSMISLAVPIGALGFWNKRLGERDVKHGEIEERWGLKRLVLWDGDGQRLELVEVDGLPDDEVWETDEVKKDVAIRWFHSARLEVDEPRSVSGVLAEVLGFESVDSAEEMSLWRNGDARGNLLEVSWEMDIWMQPGAGGVHHIAFRAKDEAEQLGMRDQVARQGLRATEVIDRYYFKSVYFRTFAGILFEIATDGPGFSADEDVEHLGERLALPPFLESRREEIEAGLVALDSNFSDE